MKKNYIIFFLLSTIASAFAQDTQMVFKKIDTVELSLDIYYPEQQKPDSPLPVIVFFFGGGWVSGDPGHFAGQCEYLASKGIVAIAPDYRTKNRHGTTPLESLADAKSAIRWIRANASDIGIQPNSLVAAGGSAGGYLALACATISDLTEEKEHKDISAVPQALVLFNPVVNTWREGFGAKRFGDLALQASPLHQLKPGLPPTLIFHGDEDKIVDINNIREFCRIATQNGDDCEIMEFPGRGHGFFNKRPNREDDFFTTLYETEKFLKNKGFLPD